MNKIFIFLLFFITAKCENKKEKINNIENVFVSLYCINEMDGSIEITNNFQKEIVLNTFILKSSVLTLEMQSTEGITQNIFGSPPPMPLENLADYDFVLSPKKTINVPINLSILKDTGFQNIKIRAKVTYQFVQGNTDEVIIYSDWVMYSEKS